LEALIASDIIENLGIAFGELFLPENKIEGGDTKEEPIS
jgi:hypothetical protein